MAKTRKPDPDPNGKATQEAQKAAQTDTASSEALHQSESAQTTQEPLQSDSPDQKAVCVSYEAGLNLREGPHRDYKSLTVIPDGETLTVLDLPEGAEVPGWALVRCGEAGAGLVGWVNTDYVREG